MAINNYVANHKQWDHVGSITPDIEISEGIRPAEEFKPAGWLPVQRYDKHYEEWFVVSAGKVVALDKTGRVVPAGLKIALAVGSGDVLTYTQDDVDNKVVDLTTGIAVTAATGYTRAELDTAMTNLGLISSSEAPEDFISAPIGLAPYNYWQWAGGDGFNPAQYRNHNHNLQHQVAVLCDFYIELPLVPGVVDTAEALATAAQYGSANAYSYAATTNLPASNTTRTPISFTEGVGAPGDVATRFTNEVSTIDDVISSGDWHMAYDSGVLTVYATSAPGDTDYKITYFYYRSDASVNSYACAIGDLNPGEFVKADANSNMTLADPSSEGLDVIVGQILARDSRFPKDALDKVKTAYAGLGVEQQMPGSANGGVPANISYSGAANTVVRINLINR